jgi:hypothetical protein
VEPLPEDPVEDPLLDVELRAAVALDERSPKRLVEPRSAPRLELLPEPDPLSADEPPPPLPMLMLAVLLVYDEDEDSEREPEEPPPE